MQAADKTSDQPKQVSLRHVREEDLPLLCRMASDLNWRGEFESTLMRSPQFMRKRFAEDGFSSEAAERLMVCDASSGAVIGSVSHFLAHRYSSAREIGWKIDDPALRGQGWGTAAARALVDYLFENFDINRLSCGMDPANLASRRIAEKVGFSYEGRLRGVLFLRGRHADGEMFGLLRAEWQAARAQEAKASD